MRFCKRCGVQLLQGPTSGPVDGRNGGRRPGAGAKQKWCADCKKVLARERYQSRYTKSGHGTVGVVYFIGHTSLEWPIKIGCARRTQVKNRLATIAANCPMPIELLAGIPSDQIFRDERELHQRFAAWRLHGEWFEPAEPLIAYLEAFRL